jgi:predicted nucleotidyltransferase
MSVTCDELLKPIKPVNAETLKRLYSVVGSMPVVLLGAFARDLIFYHVLGIEVPRATMDMDICVQMASWDDFNTAREKLEKLGFTNKREEHPEKFFDANGQEVDLLPFGSLSKDGKTITWPQDGSLWTTTGIQEAHDHAWLFRIDKMELRVIPPCAMIYLKMFAIYDRPDDRKRKDTGDIQFVLKNYLVVTGGKRLRSDGSDGDVMELVEGDLELAAARVAGRDMGRILSMASAEELSEILRKETVSETWKPIAQQLANFHKGQFGRARAILISLRDGFNEVRG